MSKLLEVGVVYKLINLDNGKFYIGSTQHFNSRIKRHLRELNQNKHHSFLFQKDYNSTNEFKYDLEILGITVDYKDLEQEYLDKYVGEDKCYNLSKSSTCGDLISYHPYKDKICNKISKTLTKQYQEGRESTVGSDDKNPNWKGGISKKNCKCGKEISGDAESCAKCYFEQRDILGENNPFYGKHHSKETIEFLKNREPNYYPSNSVKIEINSVEFNSYKEAERKLKIKAPTIRHRCLSTNKKYKNYKII